MHKDIRNSRPRSEWEELIHEWIHNERDRWIVKRKLLDGLSYDALTSEYQQRYTDIPLEYDQIRRRYKAAEEQLMNHAP